jgi:PKD repeat protein
MRTTHISVLGTIALAALTACTVKDVDTPSLAGPSTFVHSITMVADRDTLTQNGVDFTDIRVTSIGPDGQSENIPLRAQIMVGGVAQDFGTLSTKTPTTPVTIRYTAPPPSPILAANVPQNVTVEVTPFNNGDFRSEFARQVTLRLEPLGVILPNNPSLVAAFTVNPASPQAGQVASFNAASTTNNGTACGQLCLYSWNFGDGATAAGVVATHAFTKQGSNTVTLTVTDARGATAVNTQVITVTAPTPPTASFTVSPTPPPTNVDIFFNASAARAAPGRTITSYSWEFGDGTGGNGVIVSHKYTGVGSFVVVLTVTDDIGASIQVTQTLAVGTTASEPTASMTTSVAGRTVTVNASASRPGTGASIVNYKFDYGDGNFENVPNPVQSHTYTGPGTFVVLLEVTDSNGKKATTTANVTIP